MTKDLEKLAEIGERKLLHDLSLSLMDIKKGLTDVESSSEKDTEIEYLNHRIRAYNYLAETCEKCGLNIKDKEKTYLEIIKNAKEYLKQYFSKISIATQSGGEIKN